MTKGGVMIGSTVSTRSSFLRRKPVRVTISAKARPSAGAGDRAGERQQTACSTPRRSGPPARQPRLQIFGGEQAVDERSRREAAVVVLDGADQDLDHREEDEDRDQRRDRDDAAGDEPVALEEPAQREPERKQHRERGHDERRTEAHAVLAFRLAELRGECLTAQPEGRSRSPVRASIPRLPRLR